MKHIKYSFEGNNGFSHKAVARCWTDAMTLANDLRDFLTTPCPDLVITFNGVEVSLDDAITIADFVCDEEKAKFEATHKKIWVHQGATTCANTYRAKWICK